MVVGSGLLATAFSHYRDNDKVIVFASGVSNSGQTEIAEYEREKKLLLSFAKHKAKLIYFSTIGLFDESIQDSLYIRHKGEMEALIAKNFPAYIIFRLPIVVGKTPNPHTLTNFIFNRIKAEEKLNVFTGACRYLLDIDDVRDICSRIIDINRFDNYAINTHFNNRLSLPSLVELFEQVMRRTAQKELVEKGECYESDNSLLMEFLNSINLTIPQEYNWRVIEKYYSQ